MLARVRRELVDYIVKETNLNRETVIKVLRAEESFIMKQISEAMKERPR
ncbi:hypothetical protein [Thermococcus sp. AM4]|jgi:hypothetical protein|nr:hypothetical protein [Thermococcus sp. AM4]EEB74055.1 conserved hypothetical protein [Thermococcus sp. AM4]